MRNTKKIFVDFLLYDEYAHEYGPTHPTTLSTLRLVDRYIKRIVHSVKLAEAPYNIIFLSDHGQTESIPIDKEKQQSIVDLKNALNNAQYEIIKTYGCPLEPNKKIIYAVPAGSTLQLYFSQSLDKALTEKEIDEEFPQFIQSILTYDEFGWVLVRQDNERAILYGKKGSVQFSRTAKPHITGRPFPTESEEEIANILLSFHNYSTFTNNGDLVLFGNVTKHGHVYSFEKHRGTHGGFYGPMTHPFIMSTHSDLTDKSMTSLFDTIAISL
jgi:hypothetical protein